MQLNAKEPLNSTILELSCNLSNKTLKEIINILILDAPQFKLNESEWYDPKALDVDFFYFMADNLDKNRTCKDYIISLEQNDDSNLIMYNIYKITPNNIKFEPVYIKITCSYDYDSDLVYGTFEESIKLVKPVEKVITIIEYE